MKNIEYLLKKTEIPNYTYDEIINILKTECEVQGETKQLVRCMEEFSELIEVLVEYKIHGKMNYINLQEEIVDCLICIEVIKILFDIQDSDVNNYRCHMYTQINLVDNCILNLSSSSIIISKCIRNRDKYERNIISLINTINETIYNITSEFELETTVLNDIISLKIKRSNKRNKKYMTPDMSELDITDTASSEISASNSVGSNICRMSHNLYERLHNIFK